MNNPAVSIIIPVYNASAFIERSIKSVMTQTYQGKLECILVDDGCSDDSIEKVQQLIGDLPSKIAFSILRHEKNRGVSAARNTGIRAATGDYFFFMDSDDEITPECIDLLVKPLAEKAYDMVVGGVRTIGNNVLHETVKLRLKDGTVLHQPQIIETYRIMWNMLPNNKLCRAAFIKDNHLWFKEGIVYEDELWNIECATLMKSMRAVGTVTYIYYIHGSNSVIKWGKNKKHYGESFKTIIQEIRLFMEEKNTYNHRLYFFIQWFFLNKYLMPFLDDKKAYMEKYREMRPIAWFKWSKRFKANGYSLKYHIRDMHYLLPLSIAPFWQYWLFKLLKK